jgi:hypothetical protein
MNSLTKSLIEEVWNTSEFTLNNHHHLGWTTMLERCKCSWRRPMLSQRWTFMRIHRMTLSKFLTHLMLSRVKLNVTLKIWKKIKKLLNPFKIITVVITHLEVFKTRKKLPQWLSTIGLKKCQVTCITRTFGRQIFTTMYCDR